MPKQKLKDRKAFNFYRSYYDVALRLNGGNSDREKFLMAIIEMQFTGKEPEIVDSDMADFAFQSQSHSIKKQLLGYTYGGTWKDAKEGGSGLPSEGTSEGMSEGGSRGYSVDTSVQEQVQVQEQDKEQGKAVYRSFEHLSLSVSEFDKLKTAGYSKEQIDDMILRIENYKDNKKYKSLYLTLNTWLKREYPPKSFVSLENEMNEIAREISSKGWGSYLSDHEDYIKQRDKLHSLLVEKLDRYHEIKMLKENDR